MTIPDYISEVFAAGGLLAQAQPGYEVRDGQIDLARAVDRAIREKKILLGEGPTGSGKSFATLVPAIAHKHLTGKKTIVSTATHVLQEQLIKKDLPTLQRVLPGGFVFAQLKGRGNYLCEATHKANEDKLRALLRLGGDRAQQVQALEAWADRTTYGDRGELAFVPDQSIWKLFGCRGDCDPGEDVCHAREAKQRARYADIVVVNHHLLMARVRFQRGIPERDDGTLCDLLIVDECHELPDIARQYWGFDVSESYALGLIKSTREFLYDPDGDLNRVADGVSLMLQRVFDRARGLATGGSDDGSSAKLSPGLLTLPPELQVGFKALLGYIGDAVAHANAVRALQPREDILAEELAAESEAAAKAAQEDERVDEGNVKDVRDLRDKLERLVENLSVITNGSDAGSVCFVSAGKNRPLKLCSRRIDVGDVVGEFLGKIPAVALVSATLTVPPTESNRTKFSFIRDELGLTGPVGERVIEIVARSPFEMAKQAALVFPAELDGEVALPPDPSLWDRGTDEERAQLWDAEARVLRRVIDAVGGRTLVLCTSYKHVDELWKRIRKGLPYKLLKQGDDSVRNLVRAFTDDETSVLIATKSFWTGVDVPGDALQALVIGRLPHPHFKDPIVEALMDRDVRRGAERPEAWMRHALPRSLMRWRQGVGRLIRTKTDVGIVVSLDGRVIGKGYGRAFRAAFMGEEHADTLVDDLGAVSKFIEWAKEQVRGS